MNDRWRLDYNPHRIDRSLDYQTSAAYAAGCVLPDSATPQPSERSRFTDPGSRTQPAARAADQSGHPIDGLLSLRRL